MMQLDCVKRLPGLIADLSVCKETVAESGTTPQICEMGDPVLLQNAEDVR